MNVAFVTRPSKQEETDEETYAPQHASWKTKLRNGLIIVLAICSIIAAIEWDRLYDRKLG
jgi:hypothetical protein